MISGILDFNGYSLGYVMPCCAHCVYCDAKEGLGNTLMHITLAQSSANTISSLNKTQEWVNQKDAVKILFTYQPERPIIDTFTKLEFSVINFTDNEYLKEFDARVVVTNGQKCTEWKFLS